MTMIWKFMILPNESFRRFLGYKALMDMISFWKIDHWNRNRGKFIKKTLSRYPIYAQREREREREFVSNVFKQARAQFFAYN